MNDRNGSRSSHNYNDNDSNGTGHRNDNNTNSLTSGEMVLKMIGRGRWGGDGEVDELQVIEHERCENDVDVVEEYDEEAQHAERGGEDNLNGHGGGVGGSSTASKPSSSEIAPPPPTLLGANNNHRVTSVSDVVARRRREREQKQQQQRGKLPQQLRPGNNSIDGRIRRRRNSHPPQRRGGHNRELHDGDAVSLTSYDVALAAVPPELNRVVRTMPGAFRSGADVIASSATTTDNGSCSAAGTIAQRGNIDGGDDDHDSRREGGPHRGGHGRNTSVPGGGTTPTESSSSLPTTTHSTTSSGTPILKASLVRDISSSSSKVLARAEPLVLPERSVWGAHKREILACVAVALLIVLTLSLALTLVAETDRPSSVEENSSGDENPAVVIVPPDCGLLFCPPTAAPSAAGTPAVGGSNPRVDRLGNNASYRALFSVVWGFPTNCNELVAPEMVFECSSVSSNNTSNRVIAALPVQTLDADCRPGDDTSSMICSFRTGPGTNTDGNHRAAVLAGCAAAASVAAEHEHENGVVVVTATARVLPTETVKRCSNFLGANQQNLENTYGGYGSAFVSIGRFCQNDENESSPLSSLPRRRGNASADHQSRQKRFLDLQSTGAVCEEGKSWQQAQQNLTRADDADDDSSRLQQQRAAHYCVQIEDCSSQFRCIDDNCRGSDQCSLTIPSVAASFRANTNNNGTSVGGGGGECAVPATTPNVTAMWELVERRLFRRDEVAKHIQECASDHRSCA